MKAWIPWVLAIACFGVGGAPAAKVGAEPKIVIRYATLAPSQSSFGKILKAWGRSFEKETEGRAEFRFYAVVIPAESICPARVLRITSRSSPWLPPA